MVSAPLVVAGVAAIALVAVVAVDISVNRAYALDVWDGAAWQEIGRMPVTDIGRYGSMAVRAVTIDANESDEIRFRLRADNGYFTDLSTEYQAHVFGRPATTGTLAAPARSEGNDEFTLPATRFLGQSDPAMPVEPGYKAPIGTPVGASVTILVGDQYLEAWFEIREVAR